MFNKNMKKITMAGLTFAFAIVMTACGGQNERNTNQLVVAQTSDATNLDLHASNDASSSLVLVQIFETLVRQDENMNIVPGLAESYELLEDGKTYQFNLRNDVYFHNGEKFTAHDVKFTFLRALQSPQVAHIVDQIDPNGIEIIDDYTIKISTVEPYAPFLNHLAHNAAGIMNQKAVEEAGDRVNQRPVGTGPFEFVSWTNGDRVVLRRFEDYYGEKPAFEELIIRAIAEGANRTMELETGEIDIAIPIVASDIQRVEDNNDLKLLRAQNLTTQHIGFNQNKEPFNDVRVRQAINYAVNNQLILDTILEGVGGLSTGPIGANVWGARTDLYVYEQNLEKARELLAEAGYPNGFQTTLWTSNAGTGPMIVEAVQSQLREVGIDARVEQMEWGAYIEALANGDHDMFIMGWGSVTGDADYGLYSLFHSSQPSSAGNRTFFNNERVDELLDFARSTKDPEARLEAYSEIQEIIVDEAPWLFLVTGETLVGTRKDVQGFVINPNGHHRFANVYFSETDGE